MSRHSQHEDGAYDANAANGAAGVYGVHGAHQEGGESQEPPNVYHPYPDTEPVYDAHADPAAAHGWQNAYDETAELPPVPHGLPPVPNGQGENRHSGPGRRRARGKRGDWRNRRVAVAVGAVGAVSVAALIAGFAFSGSSADGPEDKGDRGGSAADVSGTPDSSGTVAGVPGTARSSDTGEPSGAASPAPGSSVSGSASEGEAPNPRPEPPPRRPTPLPPPPPESRPRATPTASRGAVRAAPRSPAEPDAPGWREPRCPAAGARLSTRCTAGNNSLFPERDPLTMRMTKQKVTGKPSVTYVARGDPT